MPLQFQPYPQQTQPQPSDPVLLGQQTGAVSQTLQHLGQQALDWRQQQFKNNLAAQENLRQQQQFNIGNFGDINGPTAAAGPGNTSGIPTDPTPTIQNPMPTQPKSASTGKPILGSYQGGPPLGGGEARSVMAPALSPALSGLSSGGLFGGVSGGSQFGGPSSIGQPSVATPAPSTGMPLGGMPSSQGPKPMMAPYQIQGATQQQAYQDLQDEHDATSSKSQMARVTLKQIMPNMNVPNTMSYADIKAQEPFITSFASKQAMLAMREMSMGTKDNQQQDKLETQARQSVANLRGDKSLARSEEQRDAAIVAYTRLQEIQTSGKGLNPVDYADILGQIYKARTGSAPGDQVLKGIQQHTAAGDLGKAYTYVTGQQAPATTQDITNSLLNMARSMGQHADKFHDGYMQAHLIKPSGLDDERWQPIAKTGRGQSFAEATGLSSLGQTPGQNQGNPQGPTGINPHPQDSAGVQWAKQNPNDPRAKKILQLNGVQ